MVNSTDVYQMSSEHGEAAPPSRHLWVGNLSPNVSQAVLRQTFSRYGVIDRIFWYSLKRYAFVNFKHQDDAENAKNKLQGTVVGGFALRIEFAKGDQRFESRNLFDGAGILRADQVHLSISDPIYGSQSHARGAKHLSAGSNMFHTIQADSGANASGASKATRDGEPTNVLWIGFPPNTRVEERDLHRAFIPFAEIERITTFPDRFYAFMELRSVEEALIAKNALSGKLFNDPRFRINFSSSEIGPVKKGNNSSVTFIPPIAEVGVSEAFIKSRSLGFPSNALTMADKFNSGPNMRPPNASMKPSCGYENMFGIGNVQGGHALGFSKRAGADHTPAAHSSSLPALSLHGRAGEWTGPADVWDLPEEDILPRDFKRARIPATPSVERFIHSSQSLNNNPQHIGFNNNPQHIGFNNGAVQSISENAPDTVNNARLLASRGDAQIQNSGESLPRHHLSGLLSFSRPVVGANFEAPFQPLSSISVEKIECLNKPRLGVVNEGWKWEGNIAKGGTFICRARCFPIGIGINVNLPEVINCTARTDLDMLGKHIFQAGDFGVVFFVPQGDVHVAPYRDFLHYLWEKHRAGVSKLGDGSSLFLVPPSDFSEKILKISRKDCLFGVVLKSQQVNSVRFELHHSQSMQQQPQTFPQLQNDVQLVPQPISQPPVQLQPPQPHLHQLPVQQLSTQPPGLSKELVSASQEYKENQGFASSEGNSSLQTGMLASIITQLTMTQSANGTLTPELIASLTALLPQTQVSSGLNLTVPVGTGTGPTASTFPGSATTGDASVQRTETAVVQPVFPVGNDGVVMKVINQPLGKINPPLPPGLPPLLQEHHTSSYMRQAPQTVGVVPSFSFSSVSPLAQRLYDPVQRVYSSEEPHSSHFAVVDQGQNLATTTLETTAQQHPTSFSYPQTPVLPPTDQLAQLFQLLVQNNQQPLEISQNANGQHENSPNLLLQPLIQQPQPFPQTPYASQVQVMQQHGKAFQGGDSIQQQILNADEAKKVTIQTEVTKDQDVEQLRFQATLQLAQTLLQQMQQQDVGGTILQ